MGSVHPGTFPGSYSSFLKTCFFYPSFSPSFLQEVLTRLQLSVIGLRLQGKCRDLGGTLRTEAVASSTPGTHSLRLGMLPGQWRPRGTHA